MIGVVKHTTIFEFRDINDLSYALSWYADKYDCESVIITDTSNRVKAVIYNETLIFAPDLSDETNYYLYGTSSTILNIKDIQKNDELPNIRNWDMDSIPFIYVVQKVPKVLDI